MYPPHPSPIQNPASSFTGLPLAATLLSLLAELMSENNSAALGNTNKPCADRAACGCGHFPSGFQVALTLHSQDVLLTRVGQNDALPGRKTQQVLSAENGAPGEAEASW